MCMRKGVKEERSRSRSGERNVINEGSAGQ